MDGSYFSDTQITNKHFKSIATVWGYNLYEIVLVGTGGLIVTSNDNGRSWQVQNAGSRDNFSSVDCTSGNTSGICYLVSESNIFSSKDRGASWQTMSASKQLLIKDFNYRTVPNSTQTVTVTLSATVNTTIPVTVTLTAYGQAVIIGNNQCTLTTAINSCSFQVKTLSWGLGKITASADGYESDTVSLIAPIPL